VEDEEGVMICTLPSTPSEHRSVGNAWKAYQRKKAEYYQTKKERKT
jgi:hypothetical protein